ncbi:MAG: efflux RND transporter periplasmic adaptor subunit [Sandaracinaceae bacterium]|nr:efflux RND transporter periplasmic adaptor subunit [Sandaracinaceae bacterium]
MDRAHTEPSIEPETPRALRALGVGLGVLALVAAGFGLGRCTAGEPSAHEAHGEAAPARNYTCSMHPQVRQTEPGTCPLCGMDLVPVGEGAGEASEARVVLDERARAIAGVRTTRVRRLSASGATVRLLGRVDYDETTFAAVTAWIGGRIDRLHVDATGVEVRRGQVVATLYSPEVLAAHQDLLTARRQLERLAGGSELSRTAASAGLEAARQRLRLLGIPDGELARMERAERPDRQVSIRSPFAGTVIERVATEGAYVETGATLYRVADLTRLWAQLDAYESDLAHLEVGQTVELGVEALPGETLEGRVAFVDPVIDARRRTARVRIALSNPDRRLRPGMFVEASVRGPEGGGAQPLVVPASAPLFTGRRSIVYVEVPGAERPTYEPRVVRLGPRAGDVYPVVAGLSEGERVVSEGAFTLDADLQIRGGPSMMTRADDRERGPLDDAIRTPAGWDAGLAPIVDAYLAMQERLAADDEAGAREATGALLDALAAFRPDAPADALRAWEPIARHLAMHARLARDAASIEAMRAQFEHVSEQIALLLRTFGNPTARPLALAFCPMAFDNRGAEWVQAREVVDNAYFGSAMRTCGSIRATVAPGAHLATEALAAPPGRTAEHRH